MLSYGPFGEARASSHTDGVNHETRIGTMMC
jgi:hypothetical protein